MTQNESHIASSYAKIRYSLYGSFLPENLINILVFFIWVLLDDNDIDSKPLLAVQLTGLYTQYVKQNTVGMTSLNSAELGYWQATYEFEEHVWKEAWLLVI